MKRKITTRNYPDNLSSLFIFLSKVRLTNTRSVNSCYSKGKKKENLETRGNRISRPNKYENAPFEVSLSFFVDVGEIISPWDRISLIPKSPSTLDEEILRLDANRARGLYFRGGRDVLGLATSQPSYASLDYVFGG